ncbi:PAS domain S-box protein [Trichocoleus desertorum AS-A10]|uniref:hybrid sensor histidine kinase/response regulator n=1 Tax=Trichocoleus desertorum TaxID=1481672 RepID=UPI0032988FBB
MRTSTEISTEIEEKFGFVPPFFSPALATPAILENLWQQTLAAYIENPLPALFKEKLSGYLSRFCPVPYCLICHSCSLYALGMQAPEILAFLELAPPDQQEIDRHLERLAAQANVAQLFSELSSTLNESLLCCAIFIALQADRAEDCRRELRQLLGNENYHYLVTFIAYIKTSHEWMKAHPDVTYEADRRFQENFATLVEQEPRLADFFNTYWLRVQQELLGGAGWMQPQATNAAEADREAAMAIANVNFAQAINSASDGILLSDPNQSDNPIIYTNPAFSRITGYSATEALGRNCRFLQGEATDPNTVAQIRQAIAQRREIQTTILNYRKDGQPFWNQLRISPVCTKGGELLYFVGLQTDITEREQTEEQIREHALLFNHSQDAILVLDLENRILFWNSGATRLFGWAANEAIGHYLDELLFDELGPSLQSAQKAVNQQGEWQGELCQRTKDGRQVTVESRWSLIRQNQIPKSILIVNTDITQRKQAENQRLRTQRFEGISTVTKGLAHDLNNALAPILMAVQLLSQKLQDEQSQQLLVMLEKNAKRSASLLQQVLDFVRGIEGEKRTIDVNQLISGVEQTLKQQFPRNILIRTNLAVTDLWLITGDAEQLHQALICLCDNAQDAMPNGGILRLVADNLWIDPSNIWAHPVSKPGPYVVITVADTGLGISGENLHRIFDPFFTTKAFGQGTGLGLSTVVGIIKGHGGAVDVSSAIGKGSQFKVYLPGIPRPTPGNNSPLLSTESSLILVVEGNSDAREMSKTLLESCGYQVLTAGDGIEAIALYAHHWSEICLVVIDMAVPELDGPTVIQALHKINSQVWVVVSTDKPLPDLVSTELRINIKAVLNQPYTHDELTNTLQTIFRR